MASWTIQSTLFFLFCLLLVLVSPQVCGASSYSSSATVTTAATTTGSTVSCITSHYELQLAVHLYLKDPTNPDTTTARQYGYPIDTWCLDGVTSLQDLFFGQWAAATFQADLSTWNVSLVTDMSRAFDGCSMLNFNVASWDTRRVTNMNKMFQHASAFTGQGLELWNVSSVTNMKRMLDGATLFHANLCDWGHQIMTTTTDMEDMFQGAAACPFQDDPNVAQNPMGPFCHWCGDSVQQQQQQEQEDGALSSILLQQQSHANTHTVGDADGSTASPYYTTTTTSMAAGQLFPPTKYLYRHVIRTALVGTISMTMVMSLS